MKSDCPKKGASRRAAANSMPRLARPPVKARGSSNRRRLTLGGAGAYAAANAHNTITVENPAPISLPNGGPTLISVDNKTLTLPSSFANQGECISFFAKNRDFALAPQGTLPSSVKLSKNFHGKLVSGLHDWCKAQAAAATKSDS